MAIDFFLILGEGDDTSNETIWIKSNLLAYPDYTVLYNSLFGNFHLSLKAVGLAAFIQSISGTIIEQKSIIEKQHKDRFTSVKTAWEELVRIGFLNKAQMYQHGKIKGTLWVVNELFLEYPHLVATALNTFQEQKGKIIAQDDQNTFFPVLYKFINSEKTTAGNTEKRLRQNALFNYFKNSDCRFIKKSELLSLWEDETRVKQYMYNSETTEKLAHNSQKYSSKRF